MSLYAGPSDPETLLNVLTFGIQDPIERERIQTQMREARARALAAKLPTIDLREAVNL